MPLFSGVVGVLADKMLPIGMLNDDIRIEITFDTSANALFSAGAATYTVNAMELELCVVELSDEGEVGYNSNSSTLQAVVRAATDDSNAEVERWYLHGAPGTDFDPAEGWSQETDYQEYDTKAQFLGGYTQD
jgi:hypothetical protein